MVEEKAPPTKQGLHGWKAAAAVFGCGTLAAFGVFGIVVAMLGTFVSTLSSGFGDSEQSAGDSVAGSAQTTSPREEFVAEKFDLCQISLPSISDVSLVLDKGTEGPVDTSIEGGAPTEDNLVRSDECAGVLHPTATTTTPWEFRFSYRAIIFSPDGDRDELAQADLEQWRDDAESSMSNFQEGGDLDLLDQAYYVYGSSPGGGAEYTAIARKRSAVLEFSMTSGDSNTPAHFENEVLKFEDHLDLALQNLIPK
ncbi:hypothetical protein HNR06_003187 [Nocardiopsis arvandica]|uniref:DUF3558 domain-containing protein n=1 Tax=Nocardiopsis sinuspersici TaxID=501010 RepID=A0A7Z0BJA8_9ACTN|nr:hypothetical protein [Nocardiopsis sinuspersici]NYH53598.1 hypothetical protein [Nocardiopsis sinuspersici]